MIPVAKVKLLEGKRGLVVGIANEQSITRPGLPSRSLAFATGIMGSFPKGKRGLVVGIANEQSIAWGCAKAFRALGRPWRNPKRSTAHWRCRQRGLACLWGSFP